MKWISQDIEVYGKSKEYVDTAVIPMIPIAFGDGMGLSASMSEFITILASQIEKQFTGRIILLPAFTYLQSEDPASAAIRLGGWVDGLSAEGIRHIFLATSDQAWRLQEDKLPGMLICLPTFPLASLQEAQKVMMINDQAKQLMGLFTNKWKED